jgi:hypothetical protein
VTKILIYLVAINLVAKIKNFSSVEDFARRLLDLNPPKALQELVRSFCKYSLLISDNLGRKGHESGETKGWI